MSDYYYNTNASSGYVNYLPMTFTSGSTSMSTGTYYPAPAVAPAPRKPTALEWLDAEVERTCAKARLAA